MTNANDSPPPLASGLRFVDHDIVLFSKDRRDHSPSTPTKVRAKNAADC